MELRNKQGLTESEFLKQYDPGNFERPSVTVDMILYTIGGSENKKTLKLLMIKRGDHPCIGQWALPGGFVNMDESLDEAAYRELKEETNIDNIYLEQLYTFGDLGRDPRTRIISCGYMALVNSNALTLEAGDDADDADWFTVKRELLETDYDSSGELISREKVRITLEGEKETLDADIEITTSMHKSVKRVERKVIRTNRIAFDHAKVIDMSIDCLRDKTFSSGIAFEFMPDEFTLTELHKVYEAIMGKRIPMAAFTRKVSSMVEETGELLKKAGQRSRLYRFNKNWKKESF